MKTNPLKEGAFTENTSGIGTATREMGFLPHSGRAFTSLFSTYETQNIIPKPKPRASRRIAVGGCKLEPKRN